MQNTQKNVYDIQKFLYTFNSVKRIEKKLKI